MYSDDVAGARRPKLDIRNLIAELDAAGQKHWRAFLVLAPPNPQELQEGQYDSVLLIRALTSGPVRLKMLRQAVTDGMVPVGLIFLDLDPRGGHFIVKASILPECRMTKGQAEKFLDQVARTIAEQRNPQKIAITKAIAEADEARFTYPLNIHVHAANGEIGSFTLAHDGQTVDRRGFDQHGPPPVRIVVYDSSQPNVRTLSVEVTAAGVEVAAERDK